MKPMVHAIVLGWIVAAMRADAAVPLLAPGTLIQDGAAAISVDVGYAAPEAADWNNDGRNDLLVGQYSYGKVRRYLNQSPANLPPTLNGYAYITNSGTDLTSEYG